MSNRVGNVLMRIRRKVWPHTDTILSVATFSFILLSWVLSLFGSNTLLVSTIVAAIGFSSAGLANALVGGIGLVRTDVRDRLPARVCGYRPDITETISNAVRLIQIISYEELQSADKSRQHFYSALRAATRKVPHQRIVWNREHLLWVRQDLEYWNNSDTSELYGYLPRPGTSVTSFMLVDGASIIFAQNWETGRHIHLDGADAARHFGFYFERMKTNSICIKRRGNPIDLGALDAFEESLAAAPACGKDFWRERPGRLRPGLRDVRYRLDVLVVAADPGLERVALVAPLRRPVQDRVVAHQELDPAPRGRIGLVDRAVLAREDAHRR